MTFLRTLFKIAALVPFIVFPSLAQTVRVASWNMSDVSPTNKSSSPAVIEQTAAQLKALSPDILFLRGAIGWKMCSQLAQALKPAEYRVLVCSAFRDPAGTALASSQIAILAKNNAYFSWSEPWSFEENFGNRSSTADAPEDGKVGREVGSRPSAPSAPHDGQNVSPTTKPPGGFCFAAIQIAGHRFGFSCVDLPNTQKGFTSHAAAQWLGTLNGYRGWVTNRLEGFVSASFGLSSANPDIARMLADAAFADPLKGNTAIAAGQVLKSHLVPSFDEPAGLVLSGWPATCDFDFKPVPVVVIAPNPTPAAASGSQPAAALPAFDRSAGLWWIGATAAFLILVAIVVMQIGIRRKLARLQLQSQSALIPIGSGSYNVVVAGPAAGSLASSHTTLPLATPARDPVLRQSLHTHLAEWLKQTFVQRLLRDRANLRETQQLAAVKVSSMDERLARVEAKIQKETASYEARIEQLNRELATAREENLELIRSQINLLKSEMATARARVLESESVED